MTLCMAAKCKDGVVAATDLAVNAGDNKVLLTSGKWFVEGKHLFLYAGTLWYVQEVRDAAPRMIREKLKVTYAEHPLEADCELLRCSAIDLTYFEERGSYYDCGDFAAIGSGADLGGALLEMVYSPNRSVKWVIDHFRNIFQIVARRRDGVSAEFDYEILTGVSRGA